MNEFLRTIYYYNLTPIHEPILFNNSITLPDKVKDIRERSGDGNDSGDGYGNDSGDGYGNGSGDGYSYGIGIGSGDGNGNSSGSGYGSGIGSGYDDD